MFLKKAQMYFDDFLKYLPKIANVTLPATLAHAKMVPDNRAELLKNIKFDLITPKQSAVMMLFYPKASMTHLALIVRTPYKGVHSAQIAFPGGKVELSDANLKATALRETHEEIGVHPKRIEIIRSFTEVYIPPSNFMVYPYLGVSQEELQFKLQPEEVAGIIELPIRDFLDEKIITKTMMSTSYAENIEVPGYQFEEHFIWGATAMIMSELKETLKMVYKV